MKQLKYSCKLKSDVILNVKSASEGPNKTLDFIPGNCFLGIVAGNGGYERLGKDAWKVFHSGQVRFGDAHPLVGNTRSLRIPASMFYPKLKKVSEKCYIHHGYCREKDHDDNGGPQQLKQCRAGFYAFAEWEGIPAQSEKSFAIKSAYNVSERRSLEGAMYGYESLREGAVFCFSVEVDDENLASRINDALVGEKRIGRSRTAQYGLVEIRPMDSFSETESGPSHSGMVTVYADSRLIFLDEDTGLPTFRPTIKDLGLESGEICDCSQVRTFQYAPWNFKRQAFDADRCGIEKGSVFVVKGCTDRNLSSKYVGAYRNEGFGRVIYNPDFLEVKDGTNGEAKYSIQDNVPTGETETEQKVPLQGTPLLAYVNRQKKRDEMQAEVYEMVNTFVKENIDRFSEDKFASQWGTIRSLAMRFPSKEALKTELFQKETGYLVHGVAKDKWEEKRRLEKFKEFFEDKSLTDENIQLAIVNLASQMAKKCNNKREKDGNK